MLVDVKDVKEDGSVLPGPGSIGFEAKNPNDLDNQSLDNQSLYMGFENDFLKYLTAYLDANLDKTQYQVEPIDVDTNAIKPPQGLTPRCTGNVLNNGAQKNHLVSYCEFINDNNQITLIDNMVSSDIPPEKLSEILTRQCNYIGQEQKLKKVFEQYIFRLEFASQQDFDNYRDCGKLETLLGKFAEDNSDFHIKVVFSDGTPETRYDSFDKLFNGTPSASNNNSTNTASSSAGSNSTTNINPSMKNPGLKAKIGSLPLQNPSPN